MIICTPGSEQMVAAVLDTSTPLTKEQAVVLATEITGDPAGRGYAEAVKAQDWRRVRELLLGHYTTEQPETTSPREAMPKGDFNVIAAGIAAAAGGGNGAQKEAWAAVRDAMFFVANFDQVSLQEERVQGAVSLLNSVGLLTPEHLSALTEVVTPAQMVTADPRSWEVLGMGMVVEVADLEGLHTEGLI